MALSKEDAAAIALCKQRVPEWYPNLYGQAYFVPPVYMNKTQHDKVMMARHEVYVQVPQSQESDIRDDTANNTVLKCIQQLSQNQVMVVVSQLEFRNILKSLTKKAKNKDGDFDTLIIHRRYGVLACEIKSVGINFDTIQKSEKDKKTIIEQKVNQAVTQLEKSRGELQRKVSHHPNPPKIRTTLMVPHIPRDQLRQVLLLNLNLQKRLRRCLNIDEKVDPVPLCLTSDDVVDPTRWWQQCVERDGPDPSMTDDVYLDLVARFVGPETTITVPCSSVPALAHCSDLRTPGEGVAETANRFAPALILLHPNQLQVCQQEFQEPLVYLCGPPGTGKTLILILRAITWIKEKHKPVHVVSTREGNIAVSHMINQQLKEMAKQTGIQGPEGTAGQAENPWVRLHIFDLPIYTKASVEELAKSEPEGELFIIVDEACDVFSSNTNEKNFTEFCTQLQARVGKGLHLWAAGMYHKLKPPNFKEVVLKTALRTPPSITCRVMEHRAIGPDKDVHGYEESSVPLPACGPEPEEVFHQGREHEGVKEPYDCEACGQKVADILNTLDVGKPGRALGKNPQPPRYRDVFLLTWDPYFHDKTTGKKAREASGLIRGLRQAKFPVTVLETGDADAAGAVATMSGPDEIVAAGSRFVQGLERKIVVCVETAQPVYFDLDWARLCSMSRSTSKLIHVKPPGSRSYQQQPAVVDPKTSGEVQ
ncbi:uncharacterized protein [Littorina saxatilis]|uniref:Uncharacterized protein n=1 Tax=Littorina saxatilis TaxID=31220 RepID=A0AAN9AZ88_9CAEN